MSIMVNECVLPSQSLIVLMQDVLELVVTYCQIQVPERLAEVDIKQPESDVNELSKASDVGKNIHQRIHCSCVVQSGCGSAKTP